MVTIIIAKTRLMDRKAGGLLGLHWEPSQIQSSSWNRVSINFNYRVFSSRLPSLWTICLWTTNTEPKVIASQLSWSINSPESRWRWWQRSCHWAQAPTRWHCPQSCCSPPGCSSPRSSRSTASLRCMLLCSCRTPQEPSFCRSLWKPQGFPDSWRNHWKRWGPPKHYLWELERKSEGPTLPKQTSSW